MSNIVAIVGRPNVGKSTLFNRLIGGRKAIVKEVSGVTRDRHYGKSEWNGKNIRLLILGDMFLDRRIYLKEKLEGRLKLPLMKPM